MVQFVSGAPLEVPPVSIQPLEGRLESLTLSLPCPEPFQAGCEEAADKNVSSRGRGVPGYFPGTQS